MKSALIRLLKIAERVYPVVDGRNKRLGRYLAAAVSEATKALRAKNKADAQREAIALAQISRPIRNADDEY